MRRIPIIAAGLAALPFFYTALDARSSTASMTVTVNVDTNRTITTSPVKFGADDPMAWKAGL